MTVQPVTYQSRNCWVDLAVNWCSSETKYRPCLEQWISGIRHSAELRRGEMVQYGIQSSARKPVSDSTWTSDHCSHVLIVTSRCCFLFLFFMSGTCGTTSCYIIWKFQFRHKAYVINHMTQQIDRFLFPMKIETGKPCARVVIFAWWRYVTGLWIILTTLNIYVDGRTRWRL